jgi:hypothetical protein
MSILERALRGWSDRGTQEIVVPEWPDEEGNPTILYSTPCTMAEKNQMVKKAGKQGNDLKAMVFIVCKKAMLENGEPAFKMTDIEDLMRGVEADVVSRIAEQITMFESVEDVKKN